MGMSDLYGPADDTENHRNDFRSYSPRFSAENIGHNLRLVDHLRQVAESKGATVAQVAIAWVLSRGVHVAPLVGARRRERLSEALGAMKLTLTGDDLRQIDRAVPLNAAAGDRYAAAQMSTLDSEAD
jgi:aryl-alcohol dehydrogenase-like predicted oxidoreductase